MIVLFNCRASHLDHECSCDMWLPKLYFSQSSAMVAVNIRIGLDSSALHRLTMGSLLLVVV